MSKSDKELLQEGFSQDLIDIGNLHWYMNEEIDMNNRVSYQDVSGFEHALGLPRVKVLHAPTTNSLFSH